MDDLKRHVKDLETLLVEILLRQKEPLTRPLIEKISAIVDIRPTREQIEGSKGIYYYVVIKHGVYMQDISFITDDVGLAKKEAEKLAKADYDDYHNWNVCIYHRGTDELHLYYQYNQKKGSRYTLPGEPFTAWEKFDGS